MTVRMLDVELSMRTTIGRGRPLGAARTGQAGVVGSFWASQRSRAARASHEYTTAVLANRSCQAYRRRLVRMPRNPRPRTMMLSGRVRVRITA